MVKQTAFLLSCFMMQTLAFNKEFDSPFRGLYTESSDTTDCVSCIDASSTWWCFYTTTKEFCCDASDTSSNCTDSKYDACSSDILNNPQNAAYLLCPEQGSST